jgi:nucleoside-diphosphate-sugar epimerase
VKIFITGIAGCLGSNLADRLLEMGHSVAGIDNFATGSEDYIANQKRIDFFRGSISDFDFLKHAIEESNPEIIIHSAASYKDPNDFYEDINTNILGMINLVNHALKMKVKKFINFQTALCYGIPESTPISIDSNLKPFTSYGISKTAGESYLINTDLSFVSLRLGNICGPRLSIGPIPTFYERLKDGKKCFCTESIRDFLDFSDFMDFIELIFEKDFQGIFNLSTGKGNSIKEIYELVCDHFNIKDKKIEVREINKDDIKEVVLDPQEAFKVGWKPKFTFEQIIKRQLKWYDNNSIDEIYSHLKK